MHIETHEIQVWSAPLTLTPEQEKQNFAILSPDERQRADRFYFPIHKQRFIAARSTLRTVLSIYLKVAAQEIEFAYDLHKKPMLACVAHSPLQFNLSHSHDLAVFAFTLNHAIGVDLEKTKDHYNPAVAKRFFSQQEVTALLSLPPQEQIIGFYRLWARKEAVIKASGKGLSLPLSSFSVSVKDVSEIVSLGQDENWILLPLSLHPGFQAAVATGQSIKKLSYWKLFEQSAQLDKVTYY